MCLSVCVLFQALSVWPTHHADFEGVEQVKGQRSHQVDDEPCGQVMDADLSSVKDHLARLADITCAKIEDNVLKGNRKKRNKSGYHKVSSIQLCINI